MPSLCIWTTFGQMRRTFTAPRKDDLGWLNDNGVLLPRRTARAFTLIELLVVIAIISILAAMLMPALSKAKSEGGEAADLNNLKQIMVALHIYTSDNEDGLPPPNWDGGTGPFAGWLYGCDLTATGTNRFVLTNGLFWPTLHQARIFVCPSDDLQMWHWSAHDQQYEQRAQELSSYGMNGAIIGFAQAIYPPVKLGTMRPEDCAYWETDETEPFYFNDGANVPTEGVSGRHMQGGLQAVFDGGANYVKLSLWYQQVLDTNRNRLWCYPNSPDGR
jgi:prepilin-type N-terminal cleavage/methylation domain-containing protein